MAQRLTEAEKTEIAEALAQKGIIHCNLCSGELMLYDAYLGVLIPDWLPNGKVNPTSALHRVVAMICPECSQMLFFHREQIELRQRPS